jgi:hypothetical protein
MRHTDPLDSRERTALPSSLASPLRHSWLIPPCRGHTQRVICLKVPLSWSPQRVIDVGGSKGHFLAQILRTHDHLRGAIFDLPYVIDSVTRPAWDPALQGSFGHLTGRVEMFPVRHGWLDGSSTVDWRRMMHNE